MTVSAVTVLFVADPLEVNYYSYMARAGRNAVAAKLAAEDITFFHVLAAEATKAMEEDVAKAMKVFSRE